MKKGIVLGLLCAALWTGQGMCTSAMSLDDFDGQSRIAVAAAIAAAIPKLEDQRAEVFKGSLRKYPELKGVPRLLQQIDEKKGLNDALAQLKAQYSALSSGNSATTEGEGITLQKNVPDASLRWLIELCNK